jgi:hypothetical protein
MYKGMHILKATFFLRVGCYLDGFYMFYNILLIAPTRKK